MQRCLVSFMLPCRIMDAAGNVCDDGGGGQQTGAVRSPGTGQTQKLGMPSMHLLTANHGAPWRHPLTAIKACYAIKYGWSAQDFP